MKAVEPKFKIGDLVTHAGFVGMIKATKEDEEGQFDFQALFVVSVLQELCSAGVQTHYYVRPLGYERYSKNVGFGKDLIRISEVELIPFVVKKTITE